MAKKVGIWIDHRKAVLVWVDGGPVLLETVESGSEKPPRHTGGSRTVAPYAAQDVGAAEKKQDRKFRTHLDAYYGVLLQKVREAESIYLMGPGEAKEEFRKRIEQSPPMQGKIDGVEAADKLTDREIELRVKDRYLPSRKPRPVAEKRQPWVRGL